MFRVFAADVDAGARHSATTEQGGRSNNLASDRHYGLENIVDRLPLHGTIRAYKQTTRLYPLAKKRSLICTKIKQQAP